MDGTTVVNESVAACEYLALVYPGSGAALLPMSSPGLVGRILQRCHETASLAAAFVAAAYPVRRPWGPLASWVPCLLCGAPPRRAIAAQRWPSTDGALAECG